MLRCARSVVGRPMLRCAQNDQRDHLIVDHQVTHVGHDRNPLAQMAQRARSEMQAEHLEVVADRGYFSGEEIVACEAAGITAYVPRPQTSNNHVQGLFGKRDFVYVAETDTYRCPAGQSLIWRYTNAELVAACGRSARR